VLDGEPGLQERLLALSEDLALAPEDAGDGRA